MIRSVTMALVASAVLFLAGCSFPDGPRDKAEWFFDKGADKIVDSLEDQDVAEARIEEAEAVLADHRSRVVDDLADAFSQQHDSFGTLLAGSDADTLLAQQDRLDGAKRAALRSIGAMHAELESTVGTSAWEAAGDARRQRFEEHTRD